MSKISRLFFFSGSHANMYRVSNFPSFLTPTHRWELSIKIDENFPNLLSFHASSESVRASVDLICWSTNCRKYPVAMEMLTWKRTTNMLVGPLNQSGLLILLFGLDGNFSFDCYLGVLWQRLPQWTTSVFLAIMLNSQTWSARADTRAV